ncbi:O-antigen ligase family protein [Marivirga sp.]|uniref:O-antigen ligase family protein n=1 Tax=Marivirga sp. TaxID=2018662 RepID=UPI003DA7608C
MKSLLQYYDNAYVALINWLYKNIVVLKLKSPFVLVLLVLATAFIVFVTTKIGFVFGVALFIGIAGTLYLLLLFIYPKIGFFTVFVIPFGMYITERKFGQSIPFATAIQFIMFLTLVVILFKKIAKKDYSFSFLHNNVTYAFLIVFLYNMFQALNPNLMNMSGWFLIAKGNFALLCTYIVSQYLARDFKFVKQLVILWVVMASITALYACYQEWFGLMDFEVRWVHADNFRFKRIFVQGRYRKFSLLSDPTSYGIFMASSTIITLILATRPMKLMLRILLLVLGVFMFLGMGYSGTRTAYAMIPAAFLIFGFLTINNIRTLVFAIIGSIAFAYILFGPIYGSAMVRRIRTTFDTEDASLNVRDVNRHAIQPYIHDHPIGGGVMTSGASGLKYNPNHDLAGFPPDSGYLKLALETGWIGLIIFMTFLFVGLKEGIRNYYYSKNLTIKFYYLAFVTFVFGITIALYAQVVTAQIPISFLFYPIMGLMSSMKYLDKERINKNI